MPLDFSTLPCSIAKTIEKLAERIDFVRLIDKGGNGYVLIGHNRLIDRKVVVKFYYWGNGVHAEPKFLSNLASDHVLKVDDAASIDKDYAYFIAPFCENGDLDDLIRKGGIGVKQAVDMLLDVAKGASFIHGKGYLHRDLKPSNIFCEIGGRLVIGDFGSVVNQGANGFAETKSCHSLLYRTPEEIKYQRACARGDVYQLGIVLYQLLGGFLSYDEKSWLKPKELDHYLDLTHPDSQIYADEIIRQKICRGQLLKISSLPPWCPAELVKVIRTCCRVDLSQRFESVSSMMGKLSNLRSCLQDWRLEPYPVLYRGRAKIRILEADGRFSIEKMVNSGDWRKVHGSKSSTMEEAVAAALQL